jgi:hypothetical protein
MSFEVKHGADAQWLIRPDRRFGINGNIEYTYVIDIILFKGYVL